MSQKPWRDATIIISVAGQIDPGERESLRGIVQELLNKARIEVELRCPSYQDARIVTSSEKYNGSWYISAARREHPQHEIFVVIKPGVVLETSLEGLKGAVPEAAQFAEEAKVSDYRKFGDAFVFRKK